MNIEIKCNLPDDTVAMKTQKVAAANPVAPKRERYFRFVVLFIVRLRMYNDAFPYAGYAEYVGCELARKCFALIKVKIYFLVEYLLSLHKNLADFVSSSRFFWEGKICNRHQNMLFLTIQGFCVLWNLLWMLNNLNSLKCTLLLRVWCLFHMCLRHLCINQHSTRKLYHIFECFSNWESSSHSFVCIAA